MYEDVYNKVFISFINLIYFTFIILNANNFVFLSLIKEKLVEYLSNFQCHKILNKESRLNSVVCKSEMINISLDCYRIS